MLLVDQIVLVLYLTVVVVLGTLWGRSARSLEQYLLGDRSLPWWAILGSIVATETSTATFLSVPGAAYRPEGDLRFLQLALGFFLGRCLVVAFLLPHYFQGQLFTAYQLLDRRFGRLAKSVTSLIFLIARNVGDGLRLFLAALALQQVVPWQLPACVLAVGLVTIVYTFLGGLRAVVWNDCIQLLVYLAGGGVALMLIVNRLPEGWAQLHAFAVAHHKLRMFAWNFDWTDPYTIWAGLVGGAFLSLGTHGTDQMMVQRLLSARSQRGAGLALITSGIVVFAQFALFLTLGIALAAFYALSPPETPFQSNDEVLSRFVVREMPAGWGLIGLIMAAVFAAAMSTLSSSLNASASAVINDFWLPARRRPVTDRQAVWASRWCTLLFGVIQMVVAIVGSYRSRLVVEEVLALANFTAGILLGIFALGVLTRRVQQAAALTGMLGGTIVLLVLHFATPIAWPWYAVVGASSTFLLGITVQFLLRWFAPPSRHREPQP